MTDHILVVEFPTQYTLAATFVRFQEHYESKKFHGRVFTLEEYMDWYAQQYDNFTYFQDWSGFNIPCTALQPFCEGKFDPLSNKETQLLELLHDEGDKFYVIGITKPAASSGKRVLKHEIAHAMYFLDPEYKRRAQRQMRAYDFSAAKAELLDMGYCRQVLQDEVQAYLVDGSNSLSAAVRRKLKPLTAKLTPLFDERSEKIKSRLATRGLDW